MKSALLLAGVISALLAGVEAKKNVVCYYGSWAVYRPGDGKFDVEQIDPYVCTHLIYGFAKLDEASSTIAAFDPYNDLFENWGKGAYERFNALKNINPELKTILAIGGWTEGSTKYSLMVKDPSTRRTFVDSIVPFLKRYGFDGLDMDWEYPTQRGGLAEDRENFVSLLTELKAAFAPEGLLLTAAVSAGEYTIDEAYDVPAVSGLLDMINLMTYDFHGGWETVTGHNAPMYAHPLDDGNLTNFNVDFAVNHWLRSGADPAKINLGMGLYGRGWTIDNENENGPYAPARSPIPAGPYTRQAGIWGYNEICEKFLAEGNRWTVVVNEFYEAPYAVNGRNWIGYDDVDSIIRKLALVDQHGLGGGMVWSIETDDFQMKCHSKPFPLISTIHEYLNGEIVIPTTTPCVGDSCTTRTTTPTTTRPSVTGSPNDQCPSEGYFAIDCTNYYYCQYNPITQEWIVMNFNCAAGTAYNVATGQCDWDYNVPGCEPAL